MSPLQRLAAFIGPSRFLALLSVYPPYLGAGVRVRRVARDLSRVDVELRLAPWNKNFVGTQFGGSLYSMCDPFFMLMLMSRLGPRYVVWDRSASIEFLRPGRGTVTAKFELPQSRVEEIRRDADASEKIFPRFDVEIVNGAGQPIATVTKVLYVRRKAPGAAAIQRRPRVSARSAARDAR
jgi:acyl-coenzyme A thioesterase PaaI-like protein